VRITQLGGVGRIAPGEHQSILWHRYEGEINRHTVRDPGSEAPVALSIGTFIAV
jgi:hypothetical protein